VLRRLPSYVAFLLLFIVSVAKAETIRWDIISLQPPNLAAGGVASARTQGGLKITVTGSGTFQVNKPNFGMSMPGTAAESVADPNRLPREEESEISASASLGRVKGGGNWTFRTPATT